LAARGKSLSAGGGRDGVSEIGEEKGKESKRFPFVARGGGGSHRGEAITEEREKGMGAGLSPQLARNDFNLEG